MESDINMLQCNACGHHQEEAADIHTNNGFNGPGAVKKPAGLRRTLSTEWIGDHSEILWDETLAGLIEHRALSAGDILIHEGGTDRDLLFLTKGCVEISSEKDGHQTLNEIQAPYLLGDIGFLSGFPRTATAKAKTQVEIFTLCYEKLRSIYKQNPDWMHPLLTSFSSSIKSLQFENIELKKKIASIKAKNGEPE